MSTTATISIRTGKRYTNVLVNFDGYPSAMLPALANVTDADVLAAQEIRAINAKGVIEAYPDAQRPTVTFEPDHSISAFVYARNASGAFVLV